MFVHPSWNQMMIVVVNYDLNDFKIKKKYSKTSVRNLPGESQLTGSNEMVTKNPSEFISSENVVVAEPYRKLREKKRFRNVCQMMKC